MINKVVKRLYTFEEFQAFPYLCPANHTTVGLGRNLDANPFTEEEAERWATEELERLWKSLLVRLPWLPGKDTEVIMIILDMAYNMGLDGVLSFKKMLQAIKESCYLLAAEELKDSKYFKQTKSRAEFHYNTLYNLDIKQNLEGLPN